MVKRNPCGCAPGCGQTKTALVSTVCLDGQVGKPAKTPARTEKYIYIPPMPDYKQDMEPSFHCYGSTKAAKRGGQAAACYSRIPGAGNKLDYCTDPSFVAPPPLASDTWTADPPGQCVYPHYCLADCFDHCPEKDWLNNRPPMR